MEPTNVFVFNPKKHWWIPAIVLVLLIVLVVFIVLLIGSDKKSSSYIPPAPVELSQETTRDVAVPDGGFEFCIRLDESEGRHLPALLGGRVEHAYPNYNKSGFNWIMLPQSTGEEGVGILPDGLIFIKTDYLAPWNPRVVQIKADLTGWVPLDMVPIMIKGKEGYGWHYDKKILEQYKK